MTLSPKSKEMIERIALRTGVSEEELITFYWWSFMEGVMDVCRRQLGEIQEQRKAA